MASLTVEIIGWIGAILILLAYFLLTSKKVKSDSRIYHLLNLFGGVGIIINAFFNTAYPSVALNIVWGLIAIYGFVKGSRLFKS